MRFPIERRRLRLGLLLLGGTGLLVSACSLPLPQAQADPTRYFLLQEGVKRPEAGDAGPVCVIRIERVEVPAYLLDKPLTVRRGPNEVRYLDAARWAEPLDQDLARNLMLGLDAVPGVTAIGRYNRADKWDYDLRVQVTACEGADGRKVLFAANWTLVPAPGSNRPGGSGSFAGRDLTWDGTSAESLAAAMSKGVTQLCEAVAAAAKPPP